MSDKGWKKFERQTAKLVAGSRYWANSGQDIDVEGPGVVVQCKNVKTCSLAQLEALAVEAERQGTQRSKIGLVYIKRRGGKGTPTRTLVVMTAEMYREMSGPLPGEVPPE